MNKYDKQNYFKGFKKNGWTFVCTKNAGTTHEADYWTKEILGHKVWKKDQRIDGYRADKKAFYHVDGAKNSDGYPVQHSFYKELIQFIEGGFQLYKVVWSDEANDGDGDHIRVSYNALTN